MFHVSTLLPFTPKDEQQVERKRHIGNDFCMIVFKEGDKPFDAMKINSQFNQCFIIVQPILNDEFKISIVTKPAIQCFGPALCDPPVFKLDENFKNYIITKLINGERTCFRGTEMQSHMIKTREKMIRYCIEKKN